MQTNENFLFGINKRQGKPKGQSNMDNPETQIAFGTRYRTETKKNKLKKTTNKTKTKTKQNKEHNTERIRKFTDSATLI